MPRVRNKRKQKPETQPEINLVDLIERFHSEDRCREYLELLRWPNGPVCPRCNCTSISQIFDRNKFDCNACRYQFSVTAGTVLHDSKLPLWKWFLATYLMVESRKSMSANQIKRMIRVSYKTAWYLCHRIRSAMGDACNEPLTGTIEADETFIGGKAKGEGRGFTGNKATVAGAVSRETGAVRLKVIPDRTRKSLHEFLQKAIDAGETDALYTDDWDAYIGMKTAGGTKVKHETVNHSIEQWVLGECHINSVENAWSLLKRAIIGAYHKISHKHLDAYLDELEWRFGNRHNPHIFRDTINHLVTADALEYEKLTS
jgi:transposase-like protein